MCGMQIGGTGSALLGVDDRAAERPGGPAERLPSGPPLHQGLLPQIPHQRDQLQPHRHEQGPSLYTPPTFTLCGTVCIRNNNNIFSPFHKQI